MKAKIYNIIIQTSPVHSWSRHNIKEVYIPELGIYFNRQCAFIDDSERFDEMAKEISDVEIEDDLAFLLKERVDLEKKVLEKQTQFLKDNGAL